MKFARALAVVWLLVSVSPLILACGSASRDLFSPSGGTGNIALAGRSAAGESTSTGGASDGGFSGSTASGGASMVAAGESAGGSPGAGALGMSGGAGLMNGGTGGSASGSGGTASGVGGAASGTSGAVSESGGAASGAGAISGASGTASGAGGVASGAGGMASGAGGGGGAAGIGGGVGCGPTAPIPNRDCNVTTPDSCFYSGVACSCLAVSLNPNVSHKWACFGTPDQCPAAKPTAGTTCRADAACPYPGNDFCACVNTGGDPHWVCQAEQVTCPQRPMDGMSCQTVRTCQYADVQCFCNGSNWGCEGG